MPTGCTRELVLEDEIRPAPQLIDRRRTGTGKIREQLLLHFPRHAGLEALVVSNVLALNLGQIVVSGILR